MVYRILSRTNALKGVQEAYVVEPGYTVLAKEALKNNIKLKNLYLTDIVTIEQRALFGCTAMKSAKFPKAVLIGKEAFANCSNLKEAIFSPYLRQIGEGAFWKCKRLQKAAFPVNKNCRIIPKQAFAECRSLKTMVLPKKLEEIKAEAFYKCDGLEEIILPETLKRIESKGFYQCGFREIMLPDGLEYIGDSAFLKCKKLEYVCIPSSVHTIEKWAFHGCNALKVLEIRHDPKYVGEWITNKNCVIRCYQGSVMETYANGYGIQTEFIRESKR